MIHPENRIAVAIDNVVTKRDIENIIIDTHEYIGIYKIGFEQFIRFGPQILEVIKKYDKKVFLDLKLHDIPNTVYKAVKSATEHNVDFLTLHTMGGSEMLKAAVKAIEETKSNTKLLGVTILTSIDKLTLQEELRMPGTIEDNVKHLAMIAASANIHGIVCSAADLKEIREFIPDEFEVVTPGIRPEGTSKDDQKRIATPKDAIKNGATILVIGRAITAANNKKMAAKEIFDSIKNL